MKKLNIEVLVGLFLVAGFLCLGWLSVKLGDIQLFGEEGYQVTARFESISGLKEGANIEIAGVRVGKVSRITLDTEEYEAVVVLQIDETIELQEDSIASIRTAGIIGEKFIKITPGGMDILIEPGGEIVETESAIQLEELISKYIFEGEN